MAEGRTKFWLKATVFDKKGRVLSVGQNSYWKTHPYQVEVARRAGRPDAIYLHAEIQALVRVKDKTKAHKIVIERYDKQGNPRPAVPCEICRMAIQEAGISIVEHT